MHRSAYPSPDALQLIDAVPTATQSAGRCMALVERIRDLALWDLRHLVCALTVVEPLAVRDALEELNWPAIVQAAEAEQAIRAVESRRATAQMHYAGLIEQMQNDPQHRAAVLEMAKGGTAARRVLREEMKLTGPQLTELLRKFRPAEPA